VDEGAGLATIGYFDNAIYAVIGIRFYNLALNWEKVWRPQGDKGSKGREFEFSKKKANSKQRRLS
jgi:hypothetical protein